MDRSYDIWDYDFDLESGYVPPGTDHLQCYDEDFHGIKNADASTPIPTRTSSPHQNNRFASAKRLFSNFARSRPAGPPEQTDFPRSPTPEALHDSIHLQGTYVVPQSQRGEQRQAAYSTSTSGLSMSNSSTTPPLTPDTFDDHLLVSPTLSSNLQDYQYDFYPDWENLPSDQPGTLEDDEDPNEYISSHSLKIREGKRPERSVVCFFFPHMVHPT